MTGQWPFDSSSTADQVLAGKDLTGQVVVITGANSGIGYETARSLAAARATVIMACREVETGRLAKLKIEAAHPGSDVECHEVNLASLASIQSFCDELDHDQVTTVICNAGVICPDYEETDDGFEYTWGVSHAGHFFLVQQLLPKLLATPKSRVIMLSSESHRSPARLDFESLPYRRQNYSVMKAYGQAKLCNALMAVELDRRYSSRGLMACFVHPGTLVTTDIGRKSAVFRLIMRLARPFTKTPAQGAATSVFCASWNPYEQLAGRYFSHCQPARPSEEATDPAIASRLWDFTDQLLKKAIRQNERVRA